MSNFPFRAPTNTELYGVKSDFADLATLFPEVDAILEGWTEVEANQVRTLLNLLYIAFTQADFFAFKDMSALLPELSATSGAKLTAIAGRLFVSQNALAYEALGRHANEKHASYFGIKGDGGDYTAQFQAALDYFANSPDMTAGGKPGRLLFDPTGTCRISDTLTYRGSVGQTLMIDCPNRPTPGQTSFLLQWDSGAGSGKDLFRFLGANCSRIKNMSLHGAYLSKFLVHVDNRFGAGQFYPSSGVTIEDCALLAHGGAGCACIAIGNSNPDVANTQTSEVFVKGGYSYGRDPPQLKPTSGTWLPDTRGPDGFGIQVLTFGNCKNFWVKDHFSAFNGVHADFGGSGNAVWSGGGLSACKTAAIRNGGNVVIEFTDYEGQVTSRYAAPLYGGQGAGANPGYHCHIRNTEAVAPLQLAGGDYTLDDVMVMSFGKLTIEHCLFINQRVDGSGNTLYAEPRVVTQGDYIQSPVAGGSGCGVSSRNNWYRGAQLTAPIFDSSGNRLTAFGFYPSLTNHTVISENDTGGNEGGAGGVKVHSLRNIRGQPIEMARLRPRDFGDNQNTNLTAGAHALVTHVSQLDYTQLLNAGAAIQGRFPFTLNPGQRVRSARLRIVTPFAGVSGGLQFWMGIIPPGGNVESYLRCAMHYLLPCDATAAAGTIFGAKDSEKGISLHSSSLPAEGFYPDSTMVNVDGTYAVALVLASVTGANLTLTAGSVVVNLDTGSDEP